ncbi:DNA-binding response regulator [Pseudomonas aeruginosa]|uniref:response regulator transcription factor n=1 Tax=Pseudomonas aeruginosa TaxID=287 RepID=UPI000CF0EBC8|nr:response regulator transcription factor [Pseudomonas aeruginosa]PPX67772.1 DNA-binding response regulator [Pseudomonas aeruginosa]HBO3681028.1 response regulator transcription factor [Pseudomonas aeruginosa]
MEKSKWSVMFPLRIAVLDDHALILLALDLRLSREADFKVVGLYTNSLELLEALQTREIDLLVLDYMLRDGEQDGLTLLKTIRRCFPQLLILMSSSAEKPWLVNLMLNAGANGFVGKTESVDRLVEAVRKVSSGETYIPAFMAYELGRDPNTAREGAGDDAIGAEILLKDSVLTPREQEVLRCCLEGMSVSHIARKFSKSMKTISGQKQSAFRKLGVRTDIELFKLERSLRYL